MKPLRENTYFGAAKNGDLESENSLSEGSHRSFRRSPTRWAAALKPPGTWDLSTRGLVTWKPSLLPTCSPALPCLGGRHPAPSPLLTHPGGWDTNFRNTAGWEEGTKDGQTLSLRYCSSA